MKSIQFFSHFTNTQYSYFVCHRLCIILAFDIVSKQNSTVSLFEKLVACILKMTSCNLASRLETFGRTLLSASSTLKMETVNTPVNQCLSTRCHGITSQNHNCERYCVVTDCSRRFLLMLASGVTNPDYPLAYCMQVSCGNLIGIPTRLSGWTTEELRFGS